MKKVTGIFSSKDLDKFGLSGINKFVVISLSDRNENIKYVRGQETFMIMGPGEIDFLHSKIILDFLEQEGLIDSRIKIHVFGGGAVCFCNPAIDFPQNEVAVKLFNKQEPMLLFFGHSYNFGICCAVQVKISLNKDVMGHYRQNFVCSAELQNASPHVETFTVAKLKTKSQE